VAREASGMGGKHMAETASNAAVANITALRRGYEAFQSGNLDLLRDELFDPDIVWHVSGRHKLAGDFHGIDAVIASFVRQFEETGGTFKVELHDILGSDDHAVALATETAERNGRSVNEPYAHVCHFRDGRLKESWLMSVDPYKVDEFYS
jgi:ketosteroid isomerase-like protein